MFFLFTCGTHGTSQRVVPSLLHFAAQAIRTLTWVDQFSDRLSRATRTSPCNVRIAATSALVATSAGRTPQNRDVDAQLLTGLQGMVHLLLRREFGQHMKLTTNLFGSTDERVHRAAHRPVLAQAVAGKEKGTATLAKDSARRLILYEQEVGCHICNFHQDIKYALLLSRSSSPTKFPSSKAKHRRRFHPVGRGLLTQ